MQTVPLDAPSAATAPPRRKIPLHVRARSVPYRRPYIIAVILTSAFYLTLVGTAASLFAFAVAPTKTAACLLIGFGGISALLWLVSFLKRRACHCPLCKGTPYADNAAHTHEKAIRFFPLNHGTSNVIRSIVSQHFRCQYCGTPFDLLKPYSRYQDEEDLLPARPTHFASLPRNGGAGRN